MAYGANILKKEAAYYSLQNASILGGVLHLGMNGSAMQEITISDLPAITDTMLFTCISDEYSERYDPNIVVLVHARMADTQEYHNAFMYPVRVAPNKYECVFTLSAGEYTEMYFTITTENRINLTLWELCPVAASEEVETIIDGVKQSLPKLLYDYNTFPLEVGQSETTVAVITARLLQNTDLQGHFLMTFLASKTATLTLRFYDNEAEELFAPLYYDTRVGYNSIGVPHAYMNRLAGLHSFVVTAQIASGILTIDTRRILFTIDGGYLAIRELEIGMDVTDIALRQLASDNGPDQIWCIGLDAGEALVRYRAYSEKNANVGWTAVGNLGRAISAAIEFDGKWVLRFGADQFTLNTEEEPWYFWVDENLFLYGCHGMPLDDRSNVIELASMVVSDVKAVRGYSSIDFLDHDQGLIVAYIKDDGFPYYRTYSYNTGRHMQIWEPEQRLNVPAYKYTFVNVHRLNDYRVGFELSGEYDNLWILSTRTYVGQSVYPENYSGISFIDDKDNFAQLVGYYPADYTPPVVNVIDQVYNEYPVENVVPITEQHWFEYDYDSSVRGIDYGTNDEVIEAYGQPVKDSDDRYYINVPDGDTTRQVYVKQFEINRHETVTEMHYVYDFTLDQEVFASEALYPVFDRITSSGLNEAQFISDIKWEHGPGYTHIIIECIQGNEQAEVSTRRYFNIIGNQTLRLRDTADPNYVTVVLDNIQVLFDFTVYIVVNQKDIYSGLHVDSNDTNYYSIGYKKVPAKDAYSGLHFDSSNTMYNVVGYKRVKAEDAMQTNIMFVGSDTAYDYVGDQPI